MTAYAFITLALLFYPILGWLLIKMFQHQPKLKRKVVLATVILSALIILCMCLNIITISEQANWFLFTLIYLAISLLVWLMQAGSESTVRTVVNALLILLLIPGYLIATVGFFFLMIMSNELAFTQRKFIADDLIYMERNIGSGPDPSERLKKIEVYKTIRWLPFLASKIVEKTYNTWSVPLQQKLNVSLSADNQKLFLSSVVNGYEVFNWNDTIDLSEK